MAAYAHLVSLLPLYSAHYVIAGILKSEYEEVVEGKKHRARSEYKHIDILINEVVYLLRERVAAQNAAIDEEVSRNERAVEPHRLYDICDDEIYFVPPLKRVCKRVQAEEHNKRHDVPELCHRAEKQREHARAQICQKVAQVEVVRERHHQRYYAQKIPRGEQHVA